MGGLGRQFFATFTGSVIIISCGMAYGWVSPVISTLMAEDGEIQADKDQISWIAADIELGNMLTPFLASYLMDKFGRKVPILCTSPILVLSWILTLTTRSIKILYIKRVMDGMGLGFVLTILPIYLAEIAEANIRGSVIISVTISWYIGMLFQYCIGSYFSYNQSAWINLVLPVLFIVMFAFLPESPYYLTMLKQEDKASESLAWYRGKHQNQVSEELNTIADYIEKDAKNKESWRAIIHNRVYRKCFLVMNVVVLTVILTGLTTVLAYASEMFANTSTGILNADTCSVAIAVLFLVVTVLVSFVIDRIGRRPLLIVSGFGCCVSNLLTAFYFYFKDQITYNWIPFLTIGLYCFFLSVGLNPVMMAFQGELFPPSIKGVAAGSCMVFVTFTSMVVLKLYYIIGTSLGMYVNYVIYTLVAGFGTVWLYYNAPETKNKTFAELFIELEALYVNKRKEPSEELQTLKVKK